MYFKFIIILSTFILVAPSTLSSQCNSISGLSIDGIALNSSTGSMCNYTARIDLVVSTAGNASACLSYFVNSVETFICWNKGTTLTNFDVNFNSDCGRNVKLSGYSSPSGSGNSCAGAITYTPPIPLPVELVRFNVQLDNNKTIVEWSTASEENNDYFEVQHSNNGRDFLPLATVKGEGTTSELQHYTYTHSEPSSGYNYYRLKQVDFDGAIEIFDVAAVRVESDMHIYNVYPSEVYDVVTLETLEFSPKDTEVSIHNANGVLMHKSILTAGAYKVTLDVSDLAIGLYFIQFLNEDAEYTAKQFVKIRG